MRTLSWAALLATVTIAACVKDKDETATTERVVTGAKTGLVAEQPFTETIEASAIVSGRPGHVAILGAPSAARVVAVHVVAGQRVTAGDVLVELDQVAFRGAVTSADAALATAESHYARQQRLVEAGIAARREVELASSELAAARAAAATAHRQAELSVIRSLIAGVVTSVAAVLGATADPAQTLVQVADGSVLDLVVSLPPAEAARLRMGASVELLGEGRESVVIGEGTLTAVGGAVDSATRAVTVRAAVRRSTRKLEIGETIPVRIAVGSHTKALVVDGIFSMFGSANFDNRSLELNDELNVAVFDRALAARLLQDFERDLTQSKKLDLESWRRRSPFERGRDALWSYFGEVF